MNNPIKFVIELTKILSKLAVLLACQIENWVYVAVLVLRHLLPYGLIKPHKIGVIGDLTGSVVINVVDHHAVGE